MSTTDSNLRGSWALILGASSGFGEATARHLASLGMNILGVHLDRRAGLEHVAEVRKELESHGVETHFANINAADDEQRAKTLEEFKAQQGSSGSGSIRVLMHSLAFGTLKPYLNAEGQPEMTRKNLEMTLDVMANSLVYWSQDIVAHRLMGDGGRIFAMTSSGGTRVIPTYGAVSAAKAALESHIRQLAFELAPFGICANAVRAGVTDTPALRKIPGNDRLIDDAKRKNPWGRLTSPEDVAQAIGILTTSAAGFISGNVIGVDGGEDIVG